MNRVIFFIAFIILLIIPFSINSFNDEGISYFEVVKKLKNEIISIVVKTSITNPSELVFSEKDKLLLDKKSKEFKIAEAKNFENNLSKDELLKSLSENTISCKTVTFRVFGLSLASINTILSFILFSIFMKLYKNYERNK